MLEMDMKVNADTIRKIVQEGHALAKAGHFDSAGILKAVEQFIKGILDTIVQASFITPLCNAL